MSIEKNILLDQISLELKAQKIVEGFITGIHKSPYRGFSVEFAEHRTYNQGDETKYIDWKIYGKSERFYVKQYEQETNMRVYFLLDTSSSMWFKHHAKWTKLQYAIHFIASLSYLLYRQRDAVGLALFNESVEQYIPPRSIYQNLKNIYTTLEEQLSKKQNRQSVKTDITYAINWIAERLKPRSLVILVSDLVPPNQDNTPLINALKRLHYEHHDVIVFHTMEERSEAKLELGSHRYTFSDMEKNTQVRATPRQLKEAYRQVWQDFYKPIINTCGELNIDYNVLDTEKELKTNLFDYLNKRKHTTR